MQLVFQLVAVVGTIVHKYKISNYIHGENFSQNNTKNRK